MKFKTTAAAIRDGYPKIIATGYCTLQHLLSWESPRAYTSGVYGWNFDVYECGNTAICTGYRGMPGAWVDYEIEKKYDEMARGKNREECHALIEEFIKEAVLASQNPKTRKTRRSSIRSRKNTRAIFAGRC